jgi:hypothetical protein
MLPLVPMLDGDLTVSNIEIPNREQLEMALEMPVTSIDMFNIRPDKWARYIEIVENFSSKFPNSEEMHMGFCMGHSYEEPYASLFDNAKDSFASYYIAGWSKEQDHLDSGNRPKMKEFRASLEQFVDTKKEGKHFHVELKNAHGS